MIRTVKKFKVIYKRPQVAPRLDEKHKLDRIKFAETIIQKVQKDPEFIKRIIFTDESYLSQEYCRGYLTKRVSRNIETQPVLNKSARKNLIIKY